MWFAGDRFERDLRRVSDVKDMSPVCPAELQRYILTLWKAFFFQLQ